MKKAVRFLMVRFYQLLSEYNRCDPPSRFTGITNEKSYNCPTSSHNETETQCCKPYKYGCCREETVVEK